MQYLAVLGRQPALGSAELESLYGSPAVQPFGKSVALIDAPVNFSRLGGCIKLAKVLAILPKTDWKTIESYLIIHANELTADVSDGKIQLGLSTYGFKESSARINASGLSLKKALRKAGHSVRLVPNQTASLSSAQVFHNHLAGDKGLELVIATDGQQTIIARSTAVQDINSYTERDRDRPKRDSRVGMLPPKLAQIIINLAVGQSNEPELTILDPFCGTGVVLQEAAIIGYSTYGTDLEPRMIDYTNQNLRWLEQRTGNDVIGATEVADATTHHWQKLNFDTVACETYLGRPYTSLPDSQSLNQNITDCNLIIKKFLSNLAIQTKPGTRICVAVPAWQTRPNIFKFLPLVDQIEQIGYNRLSFEHTSDDQLLYYREDQLVARQLLVLIRK